MRERKFFLDTNVCIDCLRGYHAHIREKLFSMSPIDIEIAAIVKAELYHGAEKSNNREKNMKLVQAFLTPYRIVPFDGVAAEIYGTIRAGLEKGGCLVGPNDLMIASTVISKNGILVTRNVKEFARITGLSFENWIPN